jgi:hypothetical protein
MTLSFWQEFARLQHACVVISQALCLFEACGTWGQVDRAIRRGLLHLHPQDPMATGAAKVVPEEGCEPHPEGSADSREDRLFTLARKKLERTAAHASAEVGSFWKPLGLGKIAVRRVQVDGTHGWERLETGRAIRRCN